MQKNCCKDPCGPSGSWGGPSGSQGGTSSPYGVYGGRSYGTYPEPSNAQASEQYSVYPPGGQQYPPGGIRPGSGDHSVLRSGGSDGTLKPASRINVWELILVPWGMLVLILICMLEGGAHGRDEVVWIMPVVLLGLCGYFIRFHYRNGSNPEVVLGLLCMTACLIGVGIGLYAVMTSLNKYNRLIQGASYANVLPIEPAASKIDATTLDFAATTSVDTTRAFGYTDASQLSAPIYCVAPVFNGDDKNTRVEFWVAGVNCCTSRSDFTCGEVNKARTHGALVHPSEVQQNQMFHSAVSGAEAAYGLTSGDHYLLVEWHHDPFGYTQGLFAGTVTTFLIFGGVYLIISAMVGYAIMPSLVSPPDDPMQSSMQQTYPPKSK